MAATVDQPFKDRYTIQDLENLSGIQAHTIRIWEKRYDLLHPLRAGNNVRFYSQEDLLKLLNISTLYKQQYKISRLASMDETELLETIRKESMQGLSDDFTSHAFKLAMLNYDQPLFDQTFKEVSIHRSFREIFSSIFIPLLNDIGMMWQTDTITIAHEHFLSNLVRQKILLQVEHLQSAQSVPGARTFVLFLPANEVHELGLLYSHYEICAHGHRSIYLGQSVPEEALGNLQSVYPVITFVTSMTTHPTDDKLESYLRYISSSLLRKGKDELWVSGRKIQGLSSGTTFSGIKLILSQEAFLKAL